MPFYEYECPSCKYYAEVLQKISERPLKKCPSCGKAGFRKLVSAPVFRLKGSGWYETDFKGESDNKRNRAGAEHEAPAAEPKVASEPKPAADAKAGTEAKGEGKGAAESKPVTDAKGAKDSKAAGAGGAGKKRSTTRAPIRRPAARVAAKRRPARPGKRR
jgi:putative FmdB family regulatory protein